jgi:hypothetical protein
VDGSHIEKREDGEGIRIWVDDVDGLLGLAAMDSVELHPSSVGTTSSIWTGSSSTSTPGQRWMERRGRDHSVASDMLTKEGQRSLAEADRRQGPAHHGAGLRPGSATTRP